MNKNYLLRILPVAGVLVALAISPVYAQSLSVTATNGSGGVKVTNNGSSASLRMANAEKNAVNRANQEITRRLTSLNTLSTRVNAMVRLSATEKTSLSSQIQTQITDMNTLQAQIAADASSNATTSLKSDIQSITKSYRIFALIIPQGAIEAMADRVQTLVSDFDAVAAKLQTRISADQSAGANVSAAVSAMTDLNAKVSDASAQSQTAVSGVSGLQPDNGVQTVMQSNTAALKAARADLQTAQQDLVAARKDAGAIVKVLESVRTSASSTSTVNSTATSSQ
jgi:hypothetical protein